MFNIDYINCIFLSAKYSLCLFIKTHFLLLYGYVFLAVKRLVVERGSIANI